MELRVGTDLSTVPAPAWNALVDDDCPFLRHEFLRGLEEFDCLAPQGWEPRHLLAYEGRRLVGALPLYLKSNSIGEFVFDWSWAEAYQRAGGRYYPKLVSAIPFTPTTSPRLLIAPDRDDAAALRRLMAEGAVEYARALGVSSLHCLFPIDVDRDAFRATDCLLRSGCQYHWSNPGYADFEAFLAALDSKRRKQVRRERREVIAAGIEYEVLDGASIGAAQWAAFYEFYCSTFARRWGEPRLTPAFFESLSTRLPRETVLFLARQRGRYVAGAFCMRGGDTLYGRSWGCSETFRFLHFELCYYQTIEYCIRHGLRRLDAGAQGEHKVARGFAPIRTWSAHWLRDPGFRRAVGQFLQREGRAIDAHIDAVNAHLPYRNSP